MCMLNSSKLAQKNIKLITKFESLELSTYLIRTYIIDVDSSRLKESVTSLRVSVYIE